MASKKMGVALGGSFARGRGVAGVLHITALVTAMVAAVVQLQLVVSTAASAVFLRPGHHLLAADHVHEDFVLVAGQAPSAVGAIPGPAQNCSDPRDQQTAACVSTSINCWSVYINNSAVMGECASFSVGNSTQLLPSPDCCSAVQSAWQLWPRRCFCSFIYFQYVQQRRRALPSLCNVTNSICQTCSAIPDLPGPVGNCGGPGKPFSSSTAGVVFASGRVEFFVCLSRVRTLNRAVLRRRSQLDPSQGDLNSWNSPLRDPFPVQRSGKF